MITLFILGCNKFNFVQTVLSLERILKSGAKKALTEGGASGIISRRSATPAKSGI